MTFKALKGAAALVMAVLLLEAGVAYAETASKYADADSWVFFGAGENRSADIFIVAPTVEMKAEYNMALDDDSKFRSKRALNMQKGL